MRIVGMIILAIGLWGFFRPEALVVMIKENFYRNPASRDLDSPKRPAAANSGRQRLLAVRIIALLWAVVGLAMMIKG